jgi:hypothetical protein
MSDGTSEPCARAGHRAERSGLWRLLLDRALAHRARVMSLLRQPRDHLRL